MSIIFKAIDDSIISDGDDTVELALLALKESENSLSCVIEKNTPEVQLVGGGKFIMIRDFD